jgi:superfamily II DNA helicase RecQ
LADDIKTVVATSALGMGYDKPDLGFVVHYQAPGSIISHHPMWRGREPPHSPPRRDFAAVD